MINMLNGIEQTELLLAAPQNFILSGATFLMADDPWRGRNPEGIRGSNASGGPARRVPMRDFSRSLPMSLLRAREAVMRQFRPSLRNHGLTEQQWRILRALAAVETIEVTELARTAFLLGPSLSRILRDLEARQSDRAPAGKADLRRARGVDLGQGPEADRGGRAVVGSDLCRHHQTLRRPETRRIAGHAWRAGTQPFRHGSGRRKAARDRPVSANLHEAIGTMHSGPANDCNHAPITVEAIDTPAIFRSKCRPSRS